MFALKSLGGLTHQGVHSTVTGIAYPGIIGDKKWDKEALRAVLAPVREFQQAYNVHIYGGEVNARRSVSPRLTLHPSHGKHASRRDASTWKTLNFVPCTPDTFVSVTRPGRRQRGARTDPSRTLGLPDTRATRGCKPLPTPSVLP